MLEINRRIENLKRTTVPAERGEKIRITEKASGVYGGWGVRYTIVFSIFISIVYRSSLFSAPHAAPH